MIATNVSREILESAAQKVGVSLDVTTLNQKERATASRSIPLRQTPTIGLPPRRMVGPIRFATATRAETRPISVRRSDTAALAAECRLCAGTDSEIYSAQCSAVSRGYLPHGCGHVRGIRGFRGAIC